LIADLAKLDGAGVGLSATLSGHDFAPVPGQARVSTLLLTDHRVQPSQTLRDLVALGPDALPFLFLLEALDDETPTKLEIRHDSRFGSMWYAAELDLNPVHPAEAAVYKELAAAAARRTNLFEGRLGSTNSHTVTAGDVCFVAIGQIVGRAYRAVRYQRSGNYVVNSPAPEREAVRPGPRHLGGRGCPSEAVQLAPDRLRDRGHLQRE
jgi:hypothetical protein